MKIAAIDLLPVSIPYRHAELSSRVSRGGVNDVVVRMTADVVISTGAAPGYFALRVGKLLGARTIWIDSMANADGLSLSGRKIGPHADLWLTQWPHLAAPHGPFYAGGVL